MNLLRAQLMAMRDTAKALTAQAEAILMALEAPHAGMQRSNGCEHPPGQRIDASTMGAPNRIVCGVCQAEVI